MTRNSTSARIRRKTSVIGLRHHVKSGAMYLLAGIVILITALPAYGAFFLYQRSDGELYRSYPIGLVKKHSRPARPYLYAPGTFDPSPMYWHDSAFKPLLPLNTSHHMLGRELLRSLREENVNISVSIPIEEIQPTISSEIEVANSETITGRAGAMHRDPPSLLSVNTRRYKAMITHDPSGSEIHGFVYLAGIWGSQLTVPDHLKRSIVNLAEAVNRFTNIEARIDNPLYLDSKDLQKAPIVFILSDTAFSLSRQEISNFGEYLKNGGFAVLDNAAPHQELSQAEASMRDMIDKALENARIAPLPISHPIYHCYFDFENGPPIGAEIELVNNNDASLNQAQATTMSREVFYLEGVWYKNRLVAVLSNKGYSLKWRNNDNNIPQLRMGVNMIVYALTRDEGIASRNRQLYNENR